MRMYWKIPSNSYDFVIDPVSCEGLPPASDGMISTYPPRDHMDGFFMARMKRLS